MLLAVDAHTQGYSKFYYPYSTYEFNYMESYIVQKFYPTTNHNFDGTILVQRVEDPGAPDDPIQITLLDNTGAISESFLVFENETGSFVPTCAVYNEQTETYCIAGINEGTGLANTATASWFLFLDKDVTTVVDAVVGGMDMTGLSINGDQNLYVTDVIACDHTLAGGQGDFAFVGIAGNTPDPSPTISTIYQRQMCLGYLAPGGTPIIGNTVSFGYTNASANNSYFPSRMVEVPLSGTDGGFVITGSGPVDGIFFLRTDYNLALNGTTYLINENSRSLYAGDLYYDPVEEEIWFAGTVRGGDYAGHIYQKLVDLSTSGITLFNNIDNMGNYRLGEMYLPDYSFAKISKIMPTLEDDEAGIAGNIYESLYYPSPDTSYSYPTLNKILFSDADLTDFASNQPLNFLWTYPRTVAGNNGLGNYLSYLSYGYLYYPSHTAHHSTPTEEYILGSSTYDPNANYPEMITINRTDNFNENNCSYSEEELSYNSFSYNQSSPTSSLNGITPTEDNLNQTTTPISIVDPNDCDNDTPFKPVKSGIAHETSELINVHHSKIFINSPIASSFSTYNLVGSKIKNGVILTPHQPIELMDLPIGVYLFEIRDKQGNRFKIQKIVVN